MKGLKNENEQKIDDIQKLLKDTMLNSMIDLIDRISDIK